MAWFRFRLKAAGYHSLISVIVAGLASIVVFYGWYPAPFNVASGGNKLFVLLISVDLVLGPLLTLAVFSPEKKRRVLMTDMLVIALLQLAALLYGLVAVYAARPIYLVHEVDRVRVITAADVEKGALEAALPEFRKLPRSGVRLIGVRGAKSAEELLASIEQAMSGKDLALRPDWWVPIDAQYLNAMARRGFTVPEFKQQKPESTEIVEELLQDRKMKQDDVILFPMIAKESGWTVVLDKTSWAVVGYLPVDGF